MKLKDSYFFTIREDAKDEDSLSGNLLVRSGMIKKSSAGIYMLLPLGFRVVKKIEKIIVDEMEKAGSSQLLMPALLTEDTFVESGRLDSFGDDMFKLKDRYDKPYVLGPTHEELFLKAAAMKIKSYKDLPFNLFQIQTKFRDEPRPRFGLIRVREFIMKDAYSFDRNLEGLDVSYSIQKQAYINIFERLEMDYRIVVASTGTMGGLLSEEFQALTDIGEDTLLFCESCDFATNIEVAESDKTCPKCGKKLISKKGIEVGNIFKLGTKYSEALGLYYTDENNNRLPVVMGSYGIGLGRCMAAIVEQKSDENGIIWPKGIAPYQVVLVLIDSEDEVQILLADQIYKDLTEAGIEVVLDNRDERAGIKFNDADLIGYPIRVVIGKGATDGKVEFKLRNEKSSIDIEISNLKEKILNALN